MFAVLCFSIKSAEVGDQSDSADLPSNTKSLCIALGIEDGYLAQLPSDVVKSLMSDSCSPEEIVVQLKESLHLGEKCLEQPNPETKRTIRCLAKRANDLNRIDVVKHLREITPAGTTGEFVNMQCLFSFKGRLYSELSQRKAIKKIFCISAKRST